MEMEKTTAVNGLGEFILAVGQSGGYILYSQDEWVNCTTADYQADDDGRVTFQGQPTKYRLTAGQLDSAIA